jgi:hypothetical protein
MSFDFPHNLSHIIRNLDEYKQNLFVEKMVSTLKEYIFNELLKGKTDIKVNKLGNILSKVVDDLNKLGVNAKIEEREEIYYEDDGSYHNAKMIKCKRISTYIVIV